MSSAGDSNQAPFTGDLGDGEPEPLRLTLIPFQNVEETVPDPDPVYASYGVRRGTGRWGKKPSVYGHFTEYAYGSVTTIDTPGVEVIRYPAERDMEVVQVGVICSPLSGLLVIDVDDPEAYAESELGDMLPLEDYAYTRRGEGGHIYLDYRHVPREKWPTQGPIQGGDVKSAGFVAAAGSLHYSGDRYERTGNPVLVANDQEVEALLEAKRGASSLDLDFTGGHADVLVDATDEEIIAAVGDSGHDDYLTSWAMRCVLRGDDDADIMAGLRRIADAIQESTPWTDAQLSGKIRSAHRKHARRMEAEQARMKAEDEAEEQARQQVQDRLRAQRMRGLDRAMQVRAQARQEAEERPRFMVNPMNTALRETSISCVPNADHEDGSRLVSGYGAIVTSLGKIAKIRKYEAELWSADWTQQAPERLLALDILGQLKDGETVYANDPRFDEQRETLESLLKNHPALLGLTRDGRIVALEGEGVDKDKDHAWFCARCRNTHRLAHWEGLPAEIVLAEGCPLDTGIDVVHSRRGKKHLVAVYVRLKQEIEDKARAEGRVPNRLKDGLTGRKIVRAWNEGERGEFACLSINKVNKLLRDLAYERTLLVRLRKARNYLRSHRCRTASPVYGLPSEYAELVSPDAEVRAQAEQRLLIEDDLEWSRFWMRREQVLGDLREQRTAVAA